jgi:hypothetical protein
MRAPWTLESWSMLRHALPGVPWTTLSGSDRARQQRFRSGPLGSERVVRFVTPRRLQARKDPEFGGNSRAALNRRCAPRLSPPANPKQRCHRCALPLSDRGAALPAPRRQSSGFQTARARGRRAGSAPRSAPPSNRTERSAERTRTGRRRALHQGPVRGSLSARSCGTWSSPVASGPTATGPFTRQAGPLATYPPTQRPDIRHSPR